MKKYVCLLFLAGSLCALGAGLSVQGKDWSDSGITGPKYEVLLQQMREMRHDYPSLVTLIDYGKSVQGRILRMVVVMKPMQVQSRPVLLMSGSTHGNEYLHIEDRLPWEILKQSQTAGPVRTFLDEGGAFLFIPVLNPDGYAMRSRFNAHNVDLNRDWNLNFAGFTGFHEVETRSLAEKLDALTEPPYNFRYKITVDYHCCAGAILYPWSYTTKPMPEEDLTKHKELGAMASHYLNIEYGTTADLLGYEAYGTTKDYYYDHFHALTFTFEGRYKVEADNFDKHVAWWDGMVSTLVPTTIKPFFTFLIGKKHPFFKFAD